MKKRLLDLSIVVLVVLALLVYFYSPYPYKQTDKKVIILGFDAADPDLIEQWIDQLPNIKKLTETGTFARLKTTNPAESPVSWSAFATGSNPGKTNIYDFLKRNVSNYMPEMATADSSEAQFILNMFPIRPPAVENNREGNPFWNITAQSGIRTVVIRAPVSFPPDEIAGGKLLSGLGVPDIRGTMGTFTYYSTAAIIRLDTEMGGKVEPIFLENGTATSIIYGPKSPFDKKDITIPVKFTVINDSVAIEVQGQKQLVREGEWSGWFAFSFPVTPIVAVQAISLFHVNEISPEMKVYLAPISMHPKYPVVPISYPPSFSGQLADEIGLYKTLGWAEDTWALNEGRIGEKVFLEDLFSVMKKTEDITMNELKKDDWSLFISVFESIDRVQHMFFRYLDKEHPMYEDSEYNSSVLDVYKEMDMIVGGIVDSYVDENTTLIILSDHGFNSFRKAVNLNSWLAENGFMELESRGREMGLSDLFGEGLFWEGVDWNRTRAYNVGLGQIYINLKGREAQGIVEPEQYMEVRDEIAGKLLELRDPETGEKVVHGVYKREEIYSGPYLENAPDLVVGFKPGYRVSWQSTLGGVTEDVIADNLEKWSGDHCSLDPHLTEGVFISNEKVGASNVSVMDIAPTALGVFGIDAPGEMDGRRLV
jgi:predicted AlkP superfamily phosphohydrolase/phosphomutase